MTTNNPTEFFVYTFGAGMLAMVMNSVFMTAPSGEAVGPVPAYVIDVMDTVMKWLMFFLVVGYLIGSWVFLGQGYQLGEGKDYARSKEVAMMFYFLGSCVSLFIGAFGAKMTYNTQKKSMETTVETDGISDVANFKARSYGKIMVFVFLGTQYWVYLLMFTKKLYNPDVNMYAWDILCVTAHTILSFFICVRLFNDDEFIKVHGHAFGKASVGDRALYGNHTNGRFTTVDLSIFEVFALVFLNFSFSVTFCDDYGQAFLWNAISIVYPLLAVGWADDFGVFIEHSVIAGVILGFIYFFFQVSYFEHRSDYTYDGRVDQHLFIYQINNTNLNWSLEPMRGVRLVHASLALVCAAIPAIPAFASMVKMCMGKKVNTVGDVADDAKVEFIRAGLVVRDTVDNIIG